jgi:hypothetical protein
MDSWDSPSISQSFRQQCRNLLGNFFRDLASSSPWFISVGHPVNGLQGTCLTSLLGFEHEGGVDFLCSIGLIRQGHSKLPNAVGVLTAA